MTHSDGSQSALRRRLAELRGGPDVPPRPLDARALAALAANPGCRRRALLDGAGVDKAALAEALGAPAPFGQSQFAFARGNSFEAKVKADGGAELIRLLCASTGETPPEPGEVALPDLSADGPSGRTARTRLALAPSRAGDEAAAGTAEGGTAAEGGWALLFHPMLALDVAGSTAYLEPDAIAVHPDGSWTVAEIKSFPVLDGSADAAKVGAAARQAAVYALALEESGVTGEVREQALLVCPKDFSNLPTAHGIDIRKQRAATRRQLARLTRLEEIAAALPRETVFDPARPAPELISAVESVPAAYAPECLSTCELAFHCRDRARAAGAVESLGRSVRGELGGFTTIDAVLSAAGAPHTGGGDAAGAESGQDAGAGGNAGAGPGADTGHAGAGSGDPAAVALRRAARLRAEALGAGRTDSRVTPCR
ncbi:hypothetical protein DB35_27775 [Streptomyces abyssalis]|uniref:Secreted protein n=1 Tax=Streptomyces abyssalis TaxID=933944 RepID=A0A1E7JJJ5_9ACTN|nr:hypothetical protein [Streptomyces abyssalis]OEU87259.1 hypothetical protein DB35_27775 [Streptomyces abyssalis]OEU87792.1 hypothetical protein AN215_15855 [Streptomyces abyssalis]